uniref:Uncharacterized protein n=1 Tax=Anopheles merus TaxID=30066 RepID=A0A182VE18_ANOME
MGNRLAAHDEHSHVHGVLTSDNLFDGTVVTNLEQYYIEPAARYSPELERRHGVHTVIYKLSDVKIHQNHHGHHRPDRGAERARNGSSDSGERVLNLATIQSSPSTQFKHVREADGQGEQRAAEVDSGRPETTKQRRTGSAALRKMRRKRRWLEEEEVIQESRNPSLPLDLEVPYNNDYTVVRSHGKTANGGGSGSTMDAGGSAVSGASGSAPSPTRPTINRTVNRGIIGGTGVGSGAPTARTPTTVVNNRKNHFLYNIYNPHGSGSTIITGGGIVGAGAEQFPWTRTINATGTNHNKDHYKMGSDEASIEAITRHVQRANLIYRKTAVLLPYTNVHQRATDQCISNQRGDWATYYRALSRCLRADKRRFTEIYSIPAGGQPHGTRGGGSHKKTRPTYYRLETAHLTSARMLTPAIECHINVAATRSEAPQTTAACEKRMFLE